MLQRPGVFRTVCTMGGGLGGCPSAGSLSENSVWMLQLLQASPLKFQTSFHRCPPPHPPTHTPTDGETGPERSSGLIRVLGIVHYQSGAFSDTDLCIFYQCPKSKCISTWVYSWARRAPKAILQNGDHPAAFFPSSLAVSLPRNLVSQPDAKSLSRPFSVTAPPSGLTGAE